MSAGDPGAVQISKQSPRSKARSTTSIADFARFGGNMSESKCSSNGWWDWDNVARSSVELAGHD